MKFLLNYILILASGEIFPSKSLALALNLLDVFDRMQGVKFDNEKGYIYESTNSCFTDYAQGLFEEGVFVSNFEYPVVPQGDARLRAQICAKHTKANLDKTLEGFSRVEKALNLI